MNRQDARSAKKRRLSSRLLIAFPGALGVLAILLLQSSAARAAGAVDTVAQDAAQGLGATPAAVVVVAAPLVTDTPAPRADEMALRIAALVAGRLGAGAHAHPQVAQLATARAIAGRASALVYVQAEIAKGDLRATLDVYPSMANGWDRIRNPLPSPTSHGFAATKIDAEVRAFLAPLILEQASVHRARHDEGEVVAVACGDIDGDGGDELVLVSRTRVAMGRLRGSKFVPERTAAWSTLAARAAVPIRETLAGAAVVPGSVYVGTTDRSGLMLTQDFAGHSLVAGVPATSSEGVVCLLANASVGGFDGAPVDCVARDARPRLAVPAPRYDAFASATIVDAQGAARSMVAVRETTGKIKLKMGDALAAPDGTFGAQLAVGDLDQDGVPDIATTVDGADDAINVFSWPSQSTELRGRLHLAAPAGVRALAMCPPEQGGEPVLVAVVGGELWLVRPGIHGAAASRGEAAADKKADR